MTQLPDATRAELAPNGRLRAALNYANTLLISTRGPDPTGMAPDLARVLEGRFTAVQQSMGVPKNRAAAASYLRDFVAEITTAGMLRDLIARHRVEGLSIVSK